MASRPIRRRALLVAGAAAAVPTLAVASAGAAGAPALAAGDIVLYRHATAPGVGDPPGFRLGECATQRNLDDSGRAQARRIGEELRERARRAQLAITAVWHSQWCRCRDTAALAFPGLPLREAPAFNSFFADRGQSAPQTQEARAELRRFRGPGLLVVVTHQVNLQALLEQTTASGEGLVARWRGEQLVLAGRLAPPG